MSVSVPTAPNSPGDTGTPQRHPLGTRVVAETGLQPSPAPGLVLGSITAAGCRCWGWGIWEGVAGASPGQPALLGSLLAAAPPHCAVCPGAARPSGRCRTRCGGCGGGWRRVCAAPAAIPREKPLPVSPRPGGRRWPADHRPPRTQHPRGRWQEAPGGVGGSVGTPPASACPHLCCDQGEVWLPAWWVAVVTASLSPRQGPEPPGAGQGGPRGHTHTEGEVGIAATAQAGAGPR